MELEIHAPHPNPQPQPHHRKIELQSSLDLSYLQQNLVKSALSKLDLHFPPIPIAPKPATIISLDGSSKDPPTAQTSEQNPQAGTEPEIEPDPLRTKVQSLLSSFLYQTWLTAQANLTLNGLEASNHSIPPEATLQPTPSSPPQPSSSTSSAQPKPSPEIEGVTFQYTPFDPRLQTKLASLHSELERLTSEVSQLRRTAPRSGAESYQAALSSKLSSEESSYNAQIEDLKTHQRPGGLQIQRTNLRKGWNEDIREVYEMGVDELSSLAGIGKNATVGETVDKNGKRKRGPNLTETMGKVQRARTVALEME